MKLNQLILPAVALGVGTAFFLSGSQDAQGWSTIGGSLSQNQRDFRIFNNFTGSSDNDNQTPTTASCPGCIRKTSLRSTLTSLVNAPQHSLDMLDVFLCLGNQ